MPVIKVWCLPKFSERKLKQLFDRIVSTVEGIPELGLKGKHSMTILFPLDAMKYGLGTEIVIEVTDLFVSPPSAKALRNRLAASLGTAVKKFLPKTKVVRCSVPPPHPEQGYWASDSLPRFGLRHKPTAGEVDEIIAGLTQPGRM